jgi:hypothetical protein
LIAEAFLCGLKTEMYKEFDSLFYQRVVGIIIISFYSLVLGREEAW